jgi:hypothetical protein
VYPFAEYEVNDDEEYTPMELGFPRPGFVGEEEFLGRATQKELVFFLGYGVSESLAFEFEAELYASATLEKSPLDTSPVPARLEESGFAGAEAQLRWRIVTTLEGEDDEIAPIDEGQLTVRPGMILKLNSGFGLTKKAVDFAPELGVLLRF